MLDFIEKFKSFEKEVEKEDNKDGIISFIEKSYVVGMEAVFVGMVLKMETSISINDQIDIMMAFSENEAFQEIRQRGVCIQLSARYGRYDFLEIIAQSNLKLGLKNGVAMLKTPYEEARDSKHIGEEERQKTLDILKKHGARGPWKKGLGGATS